MIKLNERINDLNNLNSFLNLGLYFSFIRFKFTIFLPKIQIPTPNSETLIIYNSSSKLFPHAPAQY